MGKSTNLLGVQCGAAIIAKIDDRAKALGVSRSRYATLILEKWVADGMKPVSQADRALYVLGKSFPENESVTPPQPRFGQTKKPARHRPA